VLRAVSKTFALAALAACLLGLTAASAMASHNAKRTTPAYVALGDSYAAGVGTGFYYPSSGACLRSPDAYPVLVAGARHDKLTFRACSGATTTSLAKSQLQVLSRSTSLVTVQIGGDDAGFTNVLETCVLSPANCAAAVKKSENFIAKTLPGRLGAAYSKVRTRAPKARIVVVGYPRLFGAAGKSCKAAIVTATNALALNGAANQLDQTVARAAARHHFRYVDPRSAFAGHAVCTRRPWLNAVTVPVQQSFHPTTRGERELATLVKKAA
jgi:hypothetical protein